MTPMNDSTTQTDEAAILITRTFDAPRDLVWQAWTQADHLMRWWGPAGFTAPVCEIDLRDGGKYRLCMRSPDGQEMWFAGEYTEVVPPERLAYTQVLVDEQGEPLPASAYGMEGTAPMEIHIFVTLEEQDGQTHMTFKQTGLPAGPASEGATMGWNGAFEKLAASLAA